MLPVFLRKSTPIFGVPEVDFFKACLLSKCCLGPEIVSFVFLARIFFFDCPCNILVCFRCGFLGLSLVNLFFIWV